MYHDSLAKRTGFNKYQGGRWLIVNRFDGWQNKFDAQERNQIHQQEAE